MKTTAVDFAGCYFPHGYVEAILFREHFAGCYVLRGFTIFAFISVWHTQVWVSRFQSCTYAKNNYDTGRS
jgi:hypothetical protein